jgi:4-hydroxy-2-oxoheptanedioate aldolase
MRALMREGTACYGSSRDATVILPQIETLAAPDNLDEIVAVPGIDGVYVGPMDLTIALGLEPALDSGESVFIGSLQRILEASRAAGITAVMHADADLAGKWFEQGFTAVTVATDIVVVKSGFDRALERSGG